MGVFRTVFCALKCQRCAAPFEAGVQFKTGNDYEMPRYDAGDVVADLAPGSYEGFAPAFCAGCEPRWIADAKRAHFEVLAASVEDGSVVARYGTRRLVESEPWWAVDVTREQPLSGAEIRALSAEPESRGWPSFQGRLGSIALWANGALVSPWAPGCDESWREQHRSAVRALLADRGWTHSTDDQFTDVAVWVDSRQRIRVGATKR
jgi:hypothetical protein